MVTTRPNIEGENRRALLASILESSNDSILSADANGIIISWNAASEHMFGYLAKEIIGQPIALLVPPEGKQEVAACLAKILGSERVEPYKTRRLRKDGSTFTIFLTVSPIYDGNGAITGVSGIAKDITQEEQASLYVRNMASIIESSNDAIASADTDGIFVSWNPGAERMYGYSAKEMIGQSFSRLMDPEYALEELNNQRKMRDGKKIEPYETVRIRKDGSSIPISLTVSPIYDENGAIIGVSGIARDITQEKQASQSVRDMASIIESSNDAITSANLDGICISWNAAAERMYGYSAKEIIGQTFSLLSLPENAHEDARNFSDVGDGYAIEPYDTFRVRKDGSTIPISLTVSPIYDGYGVVIGASASARDITEAKQASQSLRDMAAIIESSYDAVTTANMDRIYTSWNPAAERMFGYSAEEMIGQPISLIIPPENANEDYNNLQKIRAGDQIEPYETLRIKKDGNVIPIALTISIIYDETGAVIGWLKTI